MSRCLALLAALILLLGTAPAAAAPPSKAAAAAGTMLYQKTTKYIFEEDEVPGDLANPDFVQVDARLGVRFDTLVTPRADFIPELIKSCEDL